MLYLLPKTVSFMTAMGISEGVPGVSCNDYVMQYQ